MGYEPVPAAPGGGGGGGGVTDHGDLTGLGDNDHPQYAQLSAAGLLTHAATTGNGRRLVITGAGATVDDTVANVRTVTIPGGGVTAHSGLTGLTTGNDHTQYFLKGTDVISDTEHGSRGGAGLHALATGSAHGFLSSSDFAKLAAYPAAPYRATQTLGSAQTTITFSGLNGNAHGAYRIRLRGPTTNAGLITIEVNGSGSNVVMGLIAAANGSASISAAAAAIGYARATTFLTLDFSAAPTGAPRAFNGLISGPFDATQWFGYWFYGGWNDTSANVTSITLVTSTAGGFLASVVASIEQVPA